MRLKQPSTEPRQNRSRLTEARLLAAAIQVLDRDGLEAATVPRIAAHASLSPASIYRRFADKDALLRAAFLKMLEDSNQANAGRLHQTVARPTLEETATVLIGILLQQYRAHPRLLSALNSYIESAPGSTFAHAARSSITRNLEITAKVLLSHKDQIRHPGASLAVKFAVLAAASSIELAVLDPGTLWQTALPLTDKAFAAELTRAMVAYLCRKP
jgi:AcrR family transcriptional regulator